MSAWTGKAIENPRRFKINKQRWITWVFTYIRLPLL
jgi:hypothetical protein